MKLPIHFPSDAEVITEEVVRFRSLSPEARMRSIRGLLAAGALLIDRSPKSAFLRDYTQQQEDAARQAIKEFVARHAGRAICIPPRAGRCDADWMLTAVPGMLRLAILHHRSQRLVDRFVGGEGGANFRRQQSEVCACPIALEVLSADGTLERREIVLGAEILVVVCKLILLHIVFSPCESHFTLP